MSTILNVDFQIDHRQPFYDNHYLATARVTIQIGQSIISQETQVLVIDIEPLFNNPIIFLN